jgi:hypothetical protein
MTDVANGGPRPTLRTRATISSECAKFGGSAVGVAGGRRLQ